MYTPKSIKVIRDVETDEKGRLKNPDGGFFLLKYEIDDKYDVTIFAQTDNDKIDPNEEFIKNEFESILVTTTIRYHGEKLPRMQRRYKQRSFPTTEGFGRIKDYGEQLDAKREFIEVMEYVEDNIVAKVFNIIFDLDNESKKTVEEAVNKIFFETFGGTL